MEYEAIPLVASQVQRLQEADIHKQAPIKCQILHRLNEIDAVFNLLLYQEWMHVVQKDFQNILPIPVGDDDGDFVARTTTCGRIKST